MGQLRGQGGGRWAVVRGRHISSVPQRSKPAAPWEYTPGRARVQVGGVRAAFTRIWGKGTGAVQFPIESVSEQLAREQWQGDHGR